MAGIYIHIPFCKKACHYCDFHFSTNQNNMVEMIQAIEIEILLKKHLFENESVQSIYFGGGTPSAIATKYIAQILNTIYKNFKIHPKAEITLEANPDDLNKLKLQEIAALNINRFSIGIQSFFEEDLLWMNRAHRAIEAEKCIQLTQDAGFENISIDLIYGYHLLSDEKWAQNIQKAIQFQVPHISCYSLTVEPKTALFHQIKKGKSPKLDENISSKQFQFLIQSLQQEGFEHYEISNFAKPNRYAIHNTNYWKNTAYLGFGPSAHSYYQHQRTWNISHNHQYMEALIHRNTLPEEKEILEINEIHNELIMTSLRTQWGLDLLIFKTQFGEEKYLNLLKTAGPFLEKSWLLEKNQHFILSNEGKNFADLIASTLFIVKD